MNNMIDDKEDGRDGKIEERLFIQKRIKDNKGEIMRIVYRKEDIKNMEIERKEITKSNNKESYNKI